MNVFVLDLNPVKAAQYHNNRHCVKMILESTQILSTAAQINIGANPLLYKPTHIKHPCTLLATKNRSNYIWVLELTKALLGEYTYRFGKDHKSGRLVKHLSEIAPRIPSGELSFAQAMPDTYKKEDPVEAYRAYYRGDKRFDKAGRPLDVWTKRQKPDFMEI